MSYRKRMKRMQRARAGGCKGCAAFQAYEGSVWGACHFGPPRATSQTRWPEVRADAWCGEFLPLVIEDRAGVDRETGTSTAP